MIYCILAVPNDTNKTSEIHEKETNMAIPSEKKKVKLLELLEAISSDDDIAMDSEEDGVLVFLFIIH
jgi:hypothetical protein